MSRYTVINCMDGRVQQPVLNYLRQRWNCETIDVITEPGPVGVLSGSNEAYIEMIFRKADISFRVNNSQGLAIVAHHDCRGNPLPKEKQIEQLKISLDTIKMHFPDKMSFGLWVDEQWRVSEVEFS